MTNEQYIWNFLRQQGISEAGAAGIMGNLYAESGLSPINLQNTYNSSLGYTDQEYTNAVDNGKYKKFIKDSAGYGLAQWTYWSRKENLLNYAKSKKVSIGDLTMQLEFLISELKGYKNLFTLLCGTSSVQEASDQFLIQFERPADQSNAMKTKRAGYGTNYFNKFSSSVQLATTNIQKSKVFSNSPLISYTKISPNRTVNRTHTIDTITIHCVVGQCTVESLGNTFASPDRAASSNYGIGYDGRIAMYVEEKDRSWCTGGKDKNGNIIRVNGMSGADNDHRAITIEVASDTYAPYKITNAAYQSLLNLVTDICKRNNIKQLLWQADKNLVGQIDKQNMTVHRWFALKSCPGDYIYNLYGTIAQEVNKRLMIEEEEEVTQEQFNEMMNTWLVQQAEKEGSEWSKDARQWAEAKGLVSGDTNGKKMYKKPLTREELMMVLYRALNRNII